MNRFARWAISGMMLLTPLIFGSCSGSGNSQPSQQPGTAATPSPSPTSSPIPTGCPQVRQQIEQRISAFTPSTSPSCQADADCALFAIEKITTVDGTIAPGGVCISGCPIGLTAGRAAEWSHFLETDARLQNLCQQNLELGCRVGIPGCLMTVPACENNRCIARPAGEPPTPPPPPAEPPPALEGVNLSGTYTLDSFWCFDENGNRSVVADPDGYDEVMIIQGNSLSSNIFVKVRGLNTCTASRKGQIVFKSDGTFTLNSTTTVDLGPETPNGVCSASVPLAVTTSEGSRQQTLDMVFGTGSLNVSGEYRKDQSTGALMISNLRPQLSITGLECFARFR